MTEHGGWKIEVRTNKALDADGWRVYVDVSKTLGDSVRTVPVSFKDGRTFLSEAAAEAAGVALAKVWIDEQG